MNVEWIPALIAMNSEQIPTLAKMNAEWIPALAKMTLDLVGTIIIPRTIGAEMIPIVALVMAPP